MRRDRFAVLGMLCAMVVTAATASGQDFSYHAPEVPRAWLVLSDGIGVNGGGLSNANGVIQLLRASATVRFNDFRGVELSALRIQPVTSSIRLANDPEVNDPRADGLVLSFASLNRDGPGGGFPASAIVGAGVMRRPTNDPTKTRLTSGYMAGVESNLRDLPTDHADLTGGLRLTLLPAGNRHFLYTVEVTAGIRIG
jgi:hypothetical protein